MKTTRRFLLSISALLILTTSLFATEDKFNDEPIREHRSIIQGSDILEIRTLTDSLNINAFDARFSPFNQGIPDRDDGNGRERWVARDQVAIADHVVYSDSGNFVAIGYTLNSQRLEIRNALTGDSLFSFRGGDGGSYVAVSGNGRYVAYSTADSVWVFEWSNNRATRIFAFGFNGLTAGPPALDFTGSTLVVTASDPQVRTNKVWGFQIPNGRQVWRLDVDALQTYGWFGTSITPDGSKVICNGKYRIYVIDGRNGELIWSERSYNSESAAKLSDDGRILVTGSLSGRLRVFGFFDNSYRELWHYTFTGALSSWVTAVAVSGDGRTVAAGSLDFFNDRYEGRVALFDAGGLGRPLWISEPLPDEVSSVALSGNGGVIAVSSWGDVGHQQPDLFVYERHNPEPNYELVTNGSLSEVDINRSGTRVVACGKGTHNRQFGNGGHTHLIDVELTGGFIAGRVVDRGNAPLANVLISVGNSPYTALTGNDGRYLLRVETAIQIGVRVTASSQGWTTSVANNIPVVPGQTRQNVNFTLDETDDPPTGLRATGDVRNVVILRWDRIGGVRLPRQIRGVNEEILASDGSTQSLEHSLTGMREYRTPERDNADDATGINIYRSHLPGGPYSFLDRVAPDVSEYQDRISVFPGHDYFYVITTLYDNGESRFSEEVRGAVEDDFMLGGADLVSMRNIPEIDGTINEAEWEGAVYRDISDVIGYDRPDSAGSVVGWIGFNDRSDMLYIAVKYLNIAELPEVMGLGIYIDDDGDRTWSVRRPGSEGNYWAYWRNNGADLRYRSLTGGTYGVDPYYTFREEGMVAFSDERGYVEAEVAIPLGFHGVEEVALYAPDYAIGLGLFAMHAEAGVAIFDGWWPQDMFSIVTQPDQFARFGIGRVTTAPPFAPTNVEVTNVDEGLLVSWIDPVMALDSGEVSAIDLLNIYKNGALAGSVNPGDEAYVDEEFADWRNTWGGWYEYSIAGGILEDEGLFEGPRSRPVSAFYGETPDIEPMVNDDGSAEGFYVVSFDGADNRFAARFDVAPGIDEVAVYYVEFRHRGMQPISLYCVPDDNGVPAETEAQFTATLYEADGVDRFYFPGRSQPVLQFDPDFGGSFWVVLKYLPASPGAPAIGIDGNSTDETANLVYTAATGWQSFAVGKVMVRAGVGAPVNGVPKDFPELPEKFYVGTNFPNPFNNSTVIPVELHEDSDLRIEVFTVDGRSVGRKISGKMRAGYHRIPIRLGSEESGVYIVRVSANEQYRIRVLHLIK